MIDGRDENDFLLSNDKTKKRVEVLEDKVEQLLDFINSINGDIRCLQTEGDDEYDDYGPRNDEFKEKENDGARNST